MPAQRGSLRRQGSDEILTLERRHVDLNAGTLSLDPGTTKNDDGRIVYLPPDLKLAIQGQLQRLDAFQKQTGRVVRYLFTHTVGIHAGERIRNFIRVWTTACKAAGVPAAIFHDFRRTSVRNMVNATEPERVAMKITGHRTRSIFDRYHIVSPGDLQHAAELMANQQSGRMCTAPGFLDTRGGYQDSAPSLDRRS